MAGGRTRRVVAKVAAVALAATMVVTVAVVGTARAAAFPSMSCAIAWGSLVKSQETFSQAGLIATRTGRHDCFDRLVLEFDGGAGGYRVDYVDQVLTDGEGAVLPVAGGARLRVTLLAPAYNVNTGTVTYPHRSGDHVARVGSYRTLRDVVYGGSFEGYTTFGVGVRARLPFRVLVLAGPGTHSRIVVDVAHRW